MYPWRADRYLRKGPFPLWGFFECFSELKQGECLGRFYKYKDSNDVRNQALQLNSQWFRHVTFLGLFILIGRF